MIENFSIDMTTRARFVMVSCKNVGQILFELTLDLPNFNFLSEGHNENIKESPCVGERIIMLVIY